jgi:hypothetical protein
MTNAPPNEHTSDTSIAFSIPQAAPTSRNVGKWRIPAKVSERQTDSCYDIC